MRTFKHFPKEKKCPICGKSDDKECILAGIEGTQEGNNMEALPIHLDCIELTLLENDRGNSRSLLYMVWKR